MRNETLWMRSWRTVSLSDAPTTTADRRLLVTLDSSALKSWRSVIVPALRPYRYGVGITSVTMRESARQVELSLGEDLWRILTEVTVWGESRWGEAVWGETPADVRATVLRETGVLDESPVMVLGDDRDALRHDTILKLIDAELSKALAKGGETWSPGHRNHLRDGMILSTHARYRRDLFISDDTVAHLRHRTELERLCATRIARPSEVEHVAAEIVSGWTA